MRSKVTVVLLFLNVVLFYYIFQFEQKWRAERAQLEARRRVLPPEAATIERFVRTSVNAPTLAAEKRTDNWWLTQPIEWPANPNAISRILNELQFLEHETSFAVADLEKGSQSLADYGLAEPALVFTFTSGRREFSLKIGDRTEIGNRLYILSPDGERIHVVNRSVADSLGLATAQLRAETIFTVPIFEVRSLALQTAPPANLKIRLRREGARWGFETPILARANKNAVEVSLNALNSLTAKRFVEPRDPDADRTGLDSPQLRVTLEGNARRETLLIGAPTGQITPPREGESAGTALVEVFAKFEDKPAVFVTALPAALLDILRSGQETLRDPRVLEFEASTVSSFTFAAPNRPEFNLQRLESPTAREAWQLIVRNGAGQAPLTLPADTAVVQDFLKRLHLLSATSFLSDSPSAAELENYGFNRPEREITLSLTTGGGPRANEPSSVTLQIGARPGERSMAYARVTHAPFVYQIAPDLLTDIPTVARYFRQRLLSELPEGTLVTAITLTDLSTNAVLLQKAAPPEGALTAETIGADESTERRPQVVSLLGHLRALRAKSFNSPNFDVAGVEFNSVTVPWRYRLDFALTLTGGTAQTVTSALYFTERIGGTTQLAGTADFGGVTFELTQELLDVLFALTYAPQHDPGPPIIAPAPTPEPATGKSGNP
ncbi:MAG: DUF4340 domain-containing protein [Candidatus Didemnitutus sp.]|nr:DUF4340 domain-containing protein [Candidatus Didemnitutus sp.]